MAQRPLLSTGEGDPAVSLSPAQMAIRQLYGLTL